MSTSRPQVNIYKRDSDIRISILKFPTVILVPHSQERGVQPKRELEIQEVKKRRHLFFDSPRSRRTRYDGDDVIARVFGGYLLYDLEACFRKQWDSYHEMKMHNFKYRITLIEDKVIGRLAYIPAGTKYYYDRLFGRYMTEEVEITGKTLFDSSGVTSYLPSYNYKRGGHY